jgi:hypothetical protein
MRIYVLILCIVYLVAGDAVLSRAQDTNSCDAIFQLQANTNSFKIGESIELTCQIKNLSTNISFDVEAYPLAPGSLILTGSAGKAYIPTGLHSPSWDTSFFFPTYYHTGPEKSCQWTLAFRIDKSIPPGSYEMIARHTIFVGDTNFFAKFLTPTNQPSKSCKLESNSLGIKIQ